MGRLAARRATARNPAYVLQSVYAPSTCEHARRTARAEGLTTYDATYLELAIRRGLSLQTKDEALIGAAQRSGVAVLT